MRIINQQAAEAFITEIQRFSSDQQKNVSMAAFVIDGRVEAIAFQSIESKFLRLNEFSEIEKFESQVKDLINSEKLNFRQAILKLFSTSTVNQLSSEIQLLINELKNREISS